MVYREPQDLQGWGNPFKALYKAVGNVKDAVTDAVHDAYVEMKTYYLKDVRFVDSPSFQKVITNGGNYLKSVKWGSSKVAEWFGAMDLYDVAGAVYYDSLNDPPIDQTALGNLFAGTIRRVVPSWPTADKTGYMAANYVYTRLKGQQLFSPKEVELPTVLLALKGLGSSAGEFFKIMQQRAEEMQNGCTVKDPATWESREGDRLKQDAEVEAQIKATYEKSVQDKYLAWKALRAAQVASWSAFRQRTTDIIQAQMSVEQFAAQKKELQDQQKVLTQLEALQDADMDMTTEQLVLRRKKLRNATLAVVGAAAIWLIIGSAQKSTR